MNDILFPEGFSEKEQLDDEDLVLISDSKDGKKGKSVKGKYFTKPSSVYIKEQVDGMLEDKVDTSRKITIDGITKDLSEDVSFDVNTGGPILGQTYETTNITPDRTLDSGASQTEIAQVLGTLIQDLSLAKGIGQIDDALTTLSNTWSGYKIATELTKQSDMINKSPSITNSFTTIKGGVKNPNLVGTGSATSDAWIGYEKYGWYFHTNVTSGTVSYNQNGGVKLTVTTAGGDNRYCFIDSTDNLYSSLSSNSNKFFPLEIGAKYRFTIEYDVSGNSAGALKAFCEEQDGDGSAVQHLISISGNTTRTKQVLEFTATKKYAKLTAGYGGETAPSDGTTMNIYRMNLERILEISATSLSYPTQSINGIKGTVDLSRICQEHLTITGRHAFADGLNYRIAQSFTATKEKFAGITFQKGPTVGSISTDPKIYIQTDSGGAPGSVVATLNITSAVWNSIPDYSNYFVELPAILNVGSIYWIVFDAPQNSSNYRTVMHDANGGYAGGSFAVYNGSTWTTRSKDLYFKTHYVRKTGDINLTQHNQELAYKTDGILKNAVIDFISGRYSYKSGILTWTNKQNIKDFGENVFSSSDGGNTMSTGYITVLNKWGNNGVDSGLFTASDSNERYLTLKINTVLPVKGVTFNTGFGRDGSYKFQISSDNSNWIELLSGTSSEAVTQVAFTEMMNGLSTFYIRFYKGSSSNYMVIRFLEIFADLYTGAMPVLYNYKTNSDLYWTMPKLLTAEASKVYLRLTKYGFPALEYQDASGNILDYEYLPLDITGATSSSTDVYIKFSDISTLVQKGDGEYITLSTATSIPIINVSIKIASNRLYCGFNDSNNDLQNESSENCCLYYNVEIKGLNYIVQDLQNDVNDLRAVVQNLLNNQ